jgi:hypothetical protein
MRKYISLKNHKTLNIELYRAKDEFSLGLNLRNDFEHTISFRIALPFLFKLYLSIDTDLCKTNWWRKFLRLDEEHKYSGRNFGISFSPDEVAWGKDYFIHLEFGAYSYESGGGYSFFKTLDDLIYGKFNYSKKILNEWSRTVFIPGKGNYSEGHFDLIIREELSEWKWARFNKRFSAIYFDVECEKGVPHRFKWGIQDGLFSAAFDVSNVDEAIEKFIDRIQKERDKN